MMLHRPGVCRLFVAGVVGCLCCFCIRQAFKMPSRYLHYYFLNCLVQGIYRIVVPSHARTCRHQGCICLKRGLSGNSVVWCLREADHRLQRHYLVYIAWGLSAPWRTVYMYLSVVDSYDRIVVVQKCRAFDMFQPEACMRAFSCSASSKEHISAFVVFDYGSMYKECFVLRCPECV